MSQRPSALVVVSSSCQLYSGTGTALFDWMSYARHALDFSLLIDTGEVTSGRIASRFCGDNGIRYIPSEPEHMPGCPDHRSVAIPDVLLARSWDVMECVSWASAATNIEVLQNVSPESCLIYTPHTQPIWTLPNAGRFFMVEGTFDRMLQASDLVLIDTPDELRRVPDERCSPDKQMFVPLGVNTDRFRPVPDQRVSAELRVLAVADFREQRKRPDLLVAVLDAAVAANPDIRPVLVGRRSDRVDLPPRLASCTEQLGFVSADELVRQYQRAAVLLSLSDFEAFGMPVAEALCCGTSVLMAAQPEPLSVFGDLPGVTAVENTDVAAAAALLASMTPSANRDRVAAAAAARFGLQATYGRKLDRVLELLRLRQERRVLRGG